ncbi:MAG: AraC family transcriptional regulator [Pleurocapsa sp. MO_192.B19]|nr:AraC family transcriptional regulator [Pleurocapsa sp. MO_192.B19]
MSNQESLFVDLSQEENVLKILPRPPLYTSSEAEWKTIQFQHHHQKAGESPPCSHPHHFIIIHNLQQTTQIERTFDGKKRQEKVNTGEISLVPAGVSHHANWNQDMNFSLLIFDPTLVKRAAYESIDPDRVELIPQFAKPDPLISQIGLALNNVLKTDPQNSQFYAESMTTALIGHLLQHYSTNQPALDSFTGGIPKYKLKQAIAYINEHLAEDLSLEAIATEVGMSKYHFGRLFKQATGFSPYQYTLKCRVERGKELLLHKKLSITEVALEVGFSSHSHFTQHFKKLLGATPKQLLKSHI